MEAPPKTHDLSLLNKMCLKYSKQFSTIFDDCEILKIYGVQPRYPDEIGLGEKQTKQAITCEQKIKCFEPLPEEREEVS